ncbi:MAG: glutamate-5-semialdehyde dehydrogenase [Bulleidia sp.]
MNIEEITTRSKAAAKITRTLSAETRNTVLMQFAQNLRDDMDEILNANLQDVDNAIAAGMKASFVDRLKLSQQRIEGMARGIEETVQLPDPLNIVLEDRVLSSGIRLKKITCAIGVIGIIFESRPNVAADCAALTFKSGNACILKGGKESYLSCLAIVESMKKALRENRINEDAVILLEHPGHEETNAWIAGKGNMDLLIPRGSAKLINAVVDHAKVPVIETGAGVCHVYVDQSADIDMAVNVIINAKCQRPSVCNAMETLLVHRNIAGQLLPVLSEELKENNVKVYADEAALAWIPESEAADEESWKTEYNDLIMNLKIVENTKEAVDHIEKYGTHHSESILSEDQNEVQYFMNNIDSACVYHNASTRFTDGNEFGLGAEIGISTQKMHARGPMGLQALTTITYHLEGNGEVRK